MQKKRNQTMATMRGFTIIEVVLVLAIAGLIFLMVFIALPAMQRGQRDAQRRSDMSRFMTAIQNYQTANNNKIPTSNNDLSVFLEKYLSMVSVPASSVNQPNSITTTNNEFLDPNGTAYGVQISTLTHNTTNVNIPGLNNIVYYYTKAKCGNNSEQATFSPGANNYAIFYRLEGGGTYCGDNS